MFLPNLSGEELGRRLMEQSQTRTAAVAIMTAAGARGDAKRLSDAGFVGYLSRPVPSEHIGELVRAMIATAQLPLDERRQTGLETRYDVRQRGHRAEPVLVVDDSEINREITVGHLQGLGLRVETAESGQAAIDAARDGRYAAILIDLQLPDMPGDRVTQAIRSLPPLYRVPVLIFTAGASDAERQRCEDAGADDFLLKPINRDTLWDKLQPHLESPATSAPVQAAAGGAAQSKTYGINPRLAKVFIREADDHIDKIKAALDEPIDLDTIVRRAHALKSASQHFPENDLTSGAARLEKTAKNGDQEAIPEHVEAVEAAWHRLREVLTDATQEQAGS